MYVLYRSAWRVMNRHMYLLTSSDGGATFRETKVDDWKIGQCVMSSAAFAETPAGVLATWEAERQVFYAVIDPDSHVLSKPVAALGHGKNRKYPVVAVSDRGNVILAWTEGTSFGHGGDVVWQVFDEQGSPIPGSAGRAPGLPVWGLVAAVANPDGGFTLVY